MEMTGRLTVSNGVSRLNGTRLASAGSNSPFGAATNFLAAQGLSNGDLISITGTSGLIGSVPVIFITNAMRASAGMTLLSARSADRKGGRSTGKKSASGPERTVGSRVKKSTARRKIGTAKKSVGKAATAKHSPKKSRPK